MVSKPDTRLPHPASVDRHWSESIMCYSEGTKCQGHRAHAPKLCPLTSGWYGSRLPGAHNVKKINRPNTLRKQGTGTLTMCVKCAYYVCHGSGNCQKCTKITCLIFEDMKIFFFSWWQESMQDL